MNDNQWGNIVQLVGIFLLGAGITCEIVLRGEVYFVVITLGAIVFAIGTKIKGS